MKKIICVFALIIFAFTGCGRSESETKEQGPQISTAPEVEPNEIPTPVDDDLSDDSSQYIFTETVPLSPVPVFTLQDIINTANQRKHDLVRPDRALLYELTQERVPWTIDVGVFLESRTPQRVSAENAIADAKDLFELIRQVYGAYTYFGGDEVFLPLLEQVITSLEANDDWMNHNFGTLLHSYLFNVIRDNHFHINFSAVGVRHDFLVPSARFGNLVLEFEQSDNGFRNRATGNYISKITVNDNTIDPAEVMRLSINNYGEVHYSFALLRPQGYTGILTIVYQNGEEDSFTLRLSQTTRRSHLPASLAYVQGVPVVTIMQMGFPDSAHGLQFECARNFLSYAEQLQGEPVIIVDIRSNGGGNGSLAPRWLHTLMGTPSNRIIESDRLIILLVDRFTASAGDGFADLMFNIENTLIIGQNTNGTLHTDLRFPYMRLQRSGLLVGFGTTIYIHPKGHLPEGIGIAPDLWATGDALTAALALLQNKGD
ncbi:MAG: S41 family peptidase [Firmicutes bacterium]|nr:S41 family peptidase [Bacillota bacterium]